MFRKLSLFTSSPPKVFINNPIEGTLDDFELSDSSSSAISDMSNKSPANKLNKSISVSDIQIFNDENYNKESEVIDNQSIQNKNDNKEEQQEQQEQEEQEKQINIFNYKKCLEECNCIKCMIPLKTWLTIGNVLFQNVILENEYLYQKKYL